MRKLLASDHPTGMHNHLFLVKFIALQYRKLEPLSYIDHIYLDANTCTSNINPKKTNLNTATISAPTAGFQKPPPAKSDDGRLLRGRTRSERNSSFFLPTSSPRMAGSAWTASEDQESSFVLRNLQAMSKSLIEEEAEEEGSLLIQLLADKTPILLLHLCLSPVL